MRFMPHALIPLLNFLCFDYAFFHHNSFFCGMQKGNRYCSPLNQDYFYAFVLIHVSGDPRVGGLRGSWLLCCLMGRGAAIVTRE